MVIPGGEVAFVKRLVQESSQSENRDICQWYTSMLGKYSSVPEIIDAVKRQGVDNYAVTEFAPGQGKKTRRWAIGWSFQDRRPRMDVARGRCNSSLAKHLLPFPTDFEFKIKERTSTEIMKKLSEVMNTLEINLNITQSCGKHWIALGQVSGNVWSRATRRRKLQRQQQQQQQQQGERIKFKHEDGPHEDEQEGKEPVMVFKLIKKLDEGEDGVLIVVRWIKGHDSVLFESFCGMVKRELMTTE